MSLPKKKLGLLGTLYFSQGLPFGFFTQALPVLLRKHGHSLREIGLASLLALPWALKFLWAPLVDKHCVIKFGKRRSWIVPMQALTALLLLGLAFAPDESSFLVLFVGAFLANLLTATQDIASDALAIDILESSERGIGNGVRVGGYRTGMIVGGGAILVLLDKAGWTAAFTTMAVLIAVATIPILLTKEQPVKVEPVTQRTARHFLRLPGAARILGLLVIYKAGDAFAVGMLRPFLIDNGLELSDVGELVGTVGFLAGLIGAGAGGLLVNSLGRKRSLLVFGTLQALTVAGYALVAGAHPTRFTLGLVCAAEHLAGGMATAALFTCMMDWSRKESTATDYTVQASAVVIATGVAASLSGLSAQALGYQGHFVLAAILAGAALCAVSWLFPDESTAARPTRVAVYAGTFDPVTRGHVSVIERAASVFDRVIVLVAVNDQKVPLFDTDERLSMLRDSVSHLQGVVCDSTEGFVVEYARAHGALFLVRGVRGATDADYETTLADMNRELAPEITTVFLPAHAELSRMSSTHLKELARAGEEIARYCPPGVEQRLRAKLDPARGSIHDEVYHGV